MTNIDRPILTLPKEEAVHLKTIYQNADVILEYGSGGSTVLASEMPGKTLTSVESDPDWVASMQAYFDANPPVQGTSIDLRWADIGPTKEWGYPVDNRAYARFLDYPIGVWESGTMPQPDLVLVDGRFRVGCVLATALYTRVPVDVYVDDYAGRGQYQALENFFGTPRLIGRMAHFRVKPMPLVLRDFQAITKLMLRVK